MNCHEASERILDLLSSDQGLTNRTGMRDPELDAHLEGCASCQRELAQLQDAWANVALTTELKQPPEGLADRILDRVRGETNLAPVATVTPKPLWRHQLVSYSIAAGILLLLVGGQAYYLHRVTALTNASLDPTAEERLRSLENAVAELERLQSKSQAADIRFVSFRPDENRLPEAGPQVVGHAIWNAVAKQLHFFGYELPELAAGERFAIWFVDEQQAALATTFEPDGDGLANLIVDSPAAFVPTKALITIESEPIGDQPSKRTWCSASLANPVD